MGGNVATGSSTSSPMSKQVEPTLDKLLVGLQQQYDKGPSVYNQSLYVPAGATSQQGWGALTSAANNPNYGNAINQGLGYNTGLMGSGGITGQMQGGINNTNAATAGYGGLAASGGLTPGMQGNIDALGGVASGYGGLGANGGLSAGQQGNIGTINDVGAGYGGLSDAYAQDAPGYQTLRTQLMDDAVKNVGAGFLGSGRFGGKSYIDTATKSAVNAIAPLDYQNFQNNVANRYRSLDSRANAANTAFGMGQTGVGNQFNALAGQASTAGQQFGMGQTGVSNRLAGLGGQLAGAGQQFGLGQQGVSNALAAQDRIPGLYNASLLPGQTLSQVGAAQDANQQAIRQGDYEQFTRQNNAQADWIAKLAATLGLNAGSSGQETQSYIPWWQAALGGVSAGAGIAGKFF